LTLDIQLATSNRNTNEANCQPQLSNGTKQGTTCS